MTSFGAWFGEASTTITWWQMSLRAIVLFAYGVVLIRCSGYRAFGRYSALDIVVAAMIGSNLSRALTGNADLVATIVASTVLVALHRTLATLAALFPAVGRLLTGKAVRIVHDGEPDTRALRRHGIPMADLLEASRLRAKTDDLHQIRGAWLERSGDISVVTRP